jgi:hypothetical protein
MDQELVSAQNQKPTKEKQVSLDRNLPKFGTWVRSTLQVAVVSVFSMRYKISEGL